MKELPDVGKFRKLGKQIQHFYTFDKLVRTIDEED